MMETIISNALQVAGLIVGFVIVIFAVGSFAACGLSSRISREEEAEELRLWNEAHR